MKYPFKMSTEVVIHASPKEVWHALTDPAMVKQYLFGTNLKSDWKVGSPIVYTGEWDGKPYEDKGTILEIEPEKKLVSTYHSSQSKDEDIPENYQIVSYFLTPEGGDTILTLAQENINSQESADHSKKNWDMVLGGLKRLVEGN